MKQDKQSEPKLDSIKQELAQKVEKIMGPPPAESGPITTVAAPKTPTKPAAAKAKSPPAGDPPKQLQPLAKTANPEPVLGPPTLPGAKSPDTSAEPEAKPPEEESPPDLPVSDTSTDAQPLENNQENANAAEDKTPYDDDKDLDKAVTDIAKADSDKILKAEDEAVKRAFEPQQKQGFLSRIKNFCQAWWGNVWARRLTVLVVILSIIAVGVIPDSRYFVLNTFGVRSGASLRVVDASTQQPLRNVNVTIQDQASTTDENGVAELTNLKLGKTEITVERRAFAEQTYTHTLGWGSNPLEPVGLTPTGIQYSFMVTDFLSGQPIDKAEAISDDASAFSDESGKLVLTLDTKSDEDVEVRIVADGYRVETIDMTGKKDEQPVKMVAERKHVFVSKRSGNYDIYKIDADGANEEIVLEGSGWERDDMVLVAHPNKDVAAFVSTRENMRSTSGSLLNSLMILDVESNDVSTVEQADRFEILGWQNDKLVFVQINTDQDEPTDSQQQIFVYDYQTKGTTKIASANYFNDVVLAPNKIYYAPSTAFTNLEEDDEDEEQDEDTDANQGKLYSVNLDGSANKVLLEREVWNIFRIDYKTLNIVAGRDWFEHRLGTDIVENLSSGPPNPRSQVFTSSPNQEKHLWVDNRDGKGVLLLHDDDGSDDKILASQSGLKNPVRWLNESTVVYRVNTDDESADYVVNIHDGEPQKLTNVSSTAGIERWYYY